LGVEVVLVLVVGDSLIQEEMEALLVEEGDLLIIIIFLIMGQEETAK
jgi:hypothetical protein